MTWTLHLGAIKIIWPPYNRGTDRPGWAPAPDKGEAQGPGTAQQLRLGSRSTRRQPTLPAALG